MTKGQKRQRRYSICFKQKVVAELQRGISVTALSRKYGISGSTTVKRWVLQYGNPELLNEVVYVKMRKEADEVQSLRKEVDGMLKVRYAI
jgi:transposase-like protein